MIQGGVEYDLAFLRPLSGIESTGAQVGHSIHLELHEMGLDGPAQVLAIEPCPEIEPDDGTGRNVVTGTMAHPGPNILYLDITGLDEPLGVTDTHPIWSETRQDFVVAGQLEVGEQFRTLTGESATLTKIHPHRGPPQMVFNLEVDGEHVYSVAGCGLLVHNTCPGSIFSTKAPHQVTPGTSHLTGQHIDDLGNVEPWIARYDELGRLKARTDFNAESLVDGFADTHHHIYQWGPGQNPEEKFGHIEGIFDGPF